MKLTNFNYNLKSNDYQPVLAFSTNKNSFLIMLKLKGDVVDQKFKVKSAHFKVKHLDNDLLYNRINSIDFDAVVDPKGPAFILCMELNQQPMFGSKKENLAAGDLSLDIGKPNVVRFHLNYDCKGDNTIDDGDWPCNSLTTK